MSFTIQSCLPPPPEALPTFTLHTLTHSTQPPGESCTHKVHFLMPLYLSSLPECPHALLFIWGVPFNPSKLAQKHDLWVGFAGLLCPILNHSLCYILNIITYCTYNGTLLSQILSSSMDCVWLISVGPARSIHPGTQQVLNRCLLNWTSNWIDCHQINSHFHKHCMCSKLWTWTMNMGLFTGNHIDTACYYLPDNFTTIEYIWQVLKVTLDSGSSIFICKGKN